MYNPMVCRSFIFYIKLLGIFTKGFICVMNSGNNPLKIIPMDLDFWSFQCWWDFWRFFILSSFLCSSLLVLGLLSRCWFDLCLYVNQLTPISVNNMCLFFMWSKRFWKGNRYFLKYISHFFTKHCYSAPILCIELCNPTLNEVEW